MSIIKDLINIILTIMLLLLLYKTEEDSVAIICAAGFISLYLLKYFRLSKIVEKAINKEMEKQQKFFMEILTHDLKTPTLAQLRGLELIQNEISANMTSDQKELLNQIKNSCKYVLDMISQTLRIYHPENNIKNFTYEKVNMENLLYESFAEVNDVAKEKRIEFAYLASGINTVLEAEKSDLKIVINNMLMNAIIYSNSEEKIFIKFERYSNYLKFEILTKGMVLSEKECRKMFNNLSFDTPQYSIIGHNINLYLCKKITNCYKGKIYAQTDGKIYNKFTLELPLNNIQKYTPHYLYY